MRVRLNITVEISDAFRRGLRVRDDADGMATREEIRQFLFAEMFALYNDIEFDGREPTQAE
jgi:hypothetical protein